jgi:hypothetical protein
VNQPTVPDRLVWSFWAAGGVVFIGGLIPLAIGGTSSRISTVAIPFTIAAIAFGACGFVYRQGRAVSAILYFLAGLAVVYGLLAMFSVPLQLAAIGSCPAPPAPCPAGLGRPLTVAENTGLGFATGFGVAALFIGFFGLMVVFRKPVLAPSTPPERKIPPIEPAKPDGEPKPEPAPVAASPAPEPEPESEPEPELPAHEEEELPELPAHESESSN